ncbi:flavodoxin domain-containing protein [Pseudactinotalea terrae]|uniref:flavodoxin domain-containing protein n=1 Tax=Pseudactinotalea terrae TaxID=1743262 RepID=UPI0012E0D245|nr:flavodoxin domain-containing protein [Pseudactinotalea terrae]
MDVVVVYETHFGQTRDVASEIAAGAKDAGATTTVVSVDEATAEVVNAADLLIVGAPTQVLGMSRPWSRGLAHPQEVGTHGDIADGVREWLVGLPAVGAGRRAAAFDTKLPSALAGSAARGVAHGLRQHGFTIIGHPDHFIVEDAEGPLREGERERARAWGAELAGAVAAELRAPIAGGEQP